MGMVKPRMTSDSLADSKASAHGFKKALKRIALTPLAQGVQQPKEFAETSGAMKAAFAKLSLKLPEQAAKGTLHFRTVAKKEATIDAEGEKSIPIIDVIVPPVKDEVIQPAIPKAVKAKGNVRKVAPQTTKRYRKDPSKAAKAKANVVDDDVPIPQVKVTPKLIPFKEKAKAPVVKSDKPSTVQREKVIPPSKVVNPTHVSNQGVSQGEVQYVSYTVSAGKEPSYDDQGEFVRMVPSYEDRMTEQAYISWLEEHPNVKPSVLEGRAYKLIERDVRQHVEIGSITIFTGGTRREVLKVPVDYDHSVALKKTHNSERSRSRENNVVSIDSKRKQGVTTGVISVPAILSRSKERILADIKTRKAVARNVAMAAYRAGREMRGAVKALRLSAAKQWLRLRSGQINIAEVFPLIFCSDDALYERLRMEQEPGCIAALVIEQNDDPPRDEAPPAQGVSAGSLSVAEQIRRLEELPEIVKDDQFDSPVDMHMCYEEKAAQHMWYRDKAALQRKEQFQQDLEQYEMEKGLCMMEVLYPSHQYDEAARLDRWYDARCWADPKLEEARYDSWMFNKWDAFTLGDYNDAIAVADFWEERAYENSLLRLERCEEDVPSGQWAWSPEVDVCSALYNGYGSQSTEMDTAHDEAILHEQHRQRFEQRKEHAKQEGSGRVTDDAGKPSNLNVPKPVKQNVVVGIMSSLYTHVKTFAALNPVMPKETLAAVFKGFALPYNPRKGMLPLLE